MKKISFYLTFIAPNTPQFKHHWHREISTQWTNANTDNLKPCPTTAEEFLALKEQFTKLSAALNAIIAKKKKWQQRQDWPQQR